MSLEVEVVENPAHVCAGILDQAATAGGHVVLAGGSTPKAAYHKLAQALQSEGADHGRATFWFGDERCVPPEDERSNYLMVRQALLDPLAARPAAGSPMAGSPVAASSLGGGSQPTVHRIRGELGPVGAAEHYERVLREAGAPRFDLVLLGLGPDGHTASLFPDQDSLSEGSRLAIGVPVAGLEPFVARVTLTLPALASARRVVFLAAGASKADAVTAAFGPRARPNRHVPASLLVPLASEITVLLDRAAAAGLRAEERR